MRTTPKLGLYSWDQPDDLYNFEQLAANWQILDFHNHTPGNGVPIGAGGLDVGAVIADSIASGVVGLQHLSPTVVQDLGLNSGSAVGRGATPNGGTVTTASASPVLLSPADLVSGITLSTNGLIFVAYQALWKVSAGSGAANVYLGSTAIAHGQSINGVATSFGVATSATDFSPIYSNGAGLGTSSSTTGDASEVTTGESIGGPPIMIYAAAGTYDVGIKFSVSGGTLSAASRHLWVWSMNF